MKISYKLIIYLVALLSSLGIAFNVAIDHIEQQLLKQTEAALENTHRLETARINQTLDSYARDASSLSSNTYLKSFLRYIGNYKLARDSGILLSDSTRHSLIVGIEETHYGSFSVNLDDDLPLHDLALRLRREAGLAGSAIEELRIVDRNGVSLGQTPAFSWQQKSFELVDQSMRQANTVFGPAYRTQQGQSRLSMVSPVIDDSGEVIGALLMENDLEPIINLIEHHEDFGVSKEAYIAQQDENGNAELISKLRFDRDSAFNKTLSATLNLPIHKAFNTTQGIVINDRDYRGIDSFLAIGSIKTTQWGLVLKVDTAEAYQAINHLRTMFRYFVIATFSFSVLAYLIFLHPIAIRLRRTSGAAMKVMQGDLTTRLLDKSNDEIGHLARTIDTLAHDLGIDKTKREKIEAQLRYQALHDDLTGLYNRQYAEQTLKTLSQDLQHTHTVVFLDLNGFKQVNDEHGHNIGDEVLVVVSSRLQVEVSKVPDFTLARWGGDEFVVIAPRLSEISAKKLCRDLGELFKDSISTSAGEYELSCSIGYATTNNNKRLNDALLEADANMYTEKRLSREKKVSTLRNFA